MKTYPSISTRVDFTLPYFVFDKLDGSNVRAEWTPKKGFYKFGSRTQLLTPDQVPLWPAVERMQALSDTMGHVLSRLKTPRVVCFFEWFGPNSFAGSHPDPVDAMELALLDVDVYQKGRLVPQAVLDMASGAGVRVPTLLHEGRITPELLEAVRAGTLPGVSLEGILGKGPVSRSDGGPLMFKHKSQAWLDRLKSYCGNDEALFARLR